MGRRKGGGRKAVQEELKVRLEKVDKEKLRLYAEREGLTMTEVIERYIKGLSID